MPGMRNDEVCIKDGLTTLGSRNKTPEYIYVDAVAKVMNLRMLTIFCRHIVRGHETS